MVSMLAELKTNSDEKIGYVQSSLFQGVLMETISKD